MLLEVLQRQEKSMEHQPYHSLHRARPFFSVFSLILVKWKTDGHSGLLYNTFKGKERNPECMIMLVGYGSCTLVTMSSETVADATQSVLPCRLQWESLCSLCASPGAQPTCGLLVLHVLSCCGHRSTTPFFKRGCCCIPLWRSEEHSPLLQGAVIC